MTLDNTWKVKDLRKPHALGLGLTTTCGQPIQLSRLLPQEMVVLSAAQHGSNAVSPTYHSNVSGSNISRLNTNPEESHIDIHHPQTTFWTPAVPCQRRALYGPYQSSSGSPPMAFTFKRIILSCSVNTSAFALIYHWGFLLHSCKTTPVCSGWKEFLMRHDFRRQT